MNGLCAASAACAVAPVLLVLWSGRAPSIAPRAVPVVEANDNRRAAGTLRGDTLFVDLDVRMARWYPEASDGAFIEAPVVGEVGQAPQVPGPLIRVVERTPVVVRLTNALTDSTVTWYGLSTKPGQDSVSLGPGETTTVRFAAGHPGTYAYLARAGSVDWNIREREQTVGAFIVDARGGRTDDRVFVLNVWGEPVDSTSYRNALTINGRGWPYTERVRATRGDTLRWRVVNGTVRPHPMHLHGFYYRILSRGDGTRDSILTPRERRTVVTEMMPPFSTMAMEWVAAREGNWLFHCHLAFHVVPETRFTPGMSLRITCQAMSGVTWQGSCSASRCDLDSLRSTKTVPTRARCGCWCRRARAAGVPPGRWASCCNTRRRRRRTPWRSRGQH